MAETPTNPFRNSQPAVSRRSRAATDPTPFDSVSGSSGIGAA